MRTHNCGQLRLSDKGDSVELCGWIQSNRDLGGMTFIDIRDRYGITQLVFNANTDEALRNNASKLGREFVIKIWGEVAERSNKNKKIPTGEVEVNVSKLEVLSASELPPFLIEDETDGGEDLRAEYRYLDLRRNPLKNNLIIRHKIAQQVRNYLSKEDFLELETPFLIKSTPEGARDFVVPSRMNEGEFYALPQSPQTFKQLFMLAGYDKYFQIVRCFRDEDLRADRQPEFTQIDCEMSFVQKEDILSTFENLVCHLFKEVKGVDLGKFPRMPYSEAMQKYGSDKPDLRFGMEFVELNSVVQGKGFKLFDDAELVVGIVAEGCANYTRKQIDELVDFIKRPQIGAGGLIWVKNEGESEIKSSVGKFYDANELKKWIDHTNAKEGDLILVMAGDKNKTRSALCELRLEMGKRLGLIDPNVFKPLWILDFPLLEWDEESQRFHAVHHPFTAPNIADIDLLEKQPEKVRADAYDMVINGVEIGGGSIRISNATLQSKMFELLGFTEEEAENQFGFLLKAFKYGVPPHGGIAFGFDRLVAMFCGKNSIRDVIPFPKNNSGKDTMIGSPSPIATEQLDELKLKVIS